jgi:hypothetical protein
VPELPHPAWPMAYVPGPDGTVMLATVEQDSPEDLQASAAILVVTPRGHRDDDPGFGTTPLALRGGPIDVDRLAAELAAGDDRLQVDVEETLDLAQATVRHVLINVPPGGPT